ncbi:MULTISPECIES: hypothetical protein [Aequorivita]|uniref:Bulb-type lectin domain-containing protein n=1 Tax=Aequorivita iocasae TaxID=2803865 RepID=A0ABX7DW72_9FLAO|nr:MULTISPECIES: hypothetical protein [Aequorivita]QQX77424.1 hypothetical protein JK629_03890 [Aequorivita iocasae]UCA56914.1 hypothetical protein LDL78_03910 [Aequorivita sp. F7]
MLIFKNSKLKALSLLLTIPLFLFSCGKDDGNEPEPEINGEIELVKTYGGSGIDEAVSIIEANDGSYMVLGTTRSTDGDVTGRSGTDSDFWLVKIAKTGDIIWSKTYGGSDDESASRITKTNDGGYLLSGFTTSNDGDVSENEGFQDYWVVKVDAAGTILWEENFGFSGSDQAYKAFQTSDGGYFVTGFFDVSASGGGGNDVGRGTLHGVGEFWGIKLKADGTKEWRRYFGGTNNDRSYDAVETDDGGFLMTGTSESVDFDKTDPKGTYDYWAVRLTATGDLVWTKSFGGNEIDNSYASIKTQDGNYIMVGDSRSADQDVTSPRGNADAWMVKFDDNGSKIWQKSFGGSQFDTAHSIVQRSNGDYILSGHSRSNDIDLTTNNGVNDAWIFVVDENGVLKFQKSIGGSGLDFASEAIETTDNKIVAVGNTESNDVDIPMNKGSKDFLLIKLK